MDGQKKPRRRRRTNEDAASSGEARADEEVAPRHAAREEDEDEAPHRAAPEEEEDEDVAPRRVAPAKKRPTAPLPQLEERAPRQALLIGGALLLVGLAVVGTNSGGMGSVVALVGLASIIYGIHAFGRLGGEEMTPGSIDVIARSSSKVQLVLGLVIAVVGLAAAIAGYLGLAPAGSIETAVIAFVAGGFWALRAASALSPTKKTHRAA